MTANPLKEMLDTVGSRGPGKVTVDMLYQLAEDLNCKRFVIDSGKPYFVSRMPNADGTFKHYLDR